MQKPARILGILFIAALVILMVTPVGSRINKTFILGVRLDYIIHGLIYLPWMHIYSLISRDRYNIVIGLISGVVLVIGLEYIQMLVPHRGFNLKDIIAGEVGVVISFMVTYLMRNKK